LVKDQFLTFPKGCKFCRAKIAARRRINLISHCFYCIFRLARVLQRLGGELLGFD